MGWVIIIKQHLHRDFVYKALSQGRGGAGVAPWNPGGEAAASGRSAPGPACDCAGGKQSAIHPTVSDSSEFQSLFPLSHEELTRGLSLRPEKGCREPQREGLAGARLEGRGGGGPPSLGSPTPPPHPHPLAPKRLRIRTAWLWLVCASSLANLGCVFMLKV